MNPRPSSGTKTRFSAGTSPRWATLTARPDAQYASDDSGSMTSPRSKPENPRRLIEDLVSSFRQPAESVVPWFLEKMPMVYFQDTDQHQQMEHLRAMIAAKASGQPFDYKWSNADGSQVTYMCPRNKPGVLAELIRDLPTGRTPLKAAKIHTTDDDELVLVNFLFGREERFNPEIPEQARKLESTIAFARNQSGSWTEKDVRSFFPRCSSEHVMAASEYRLSAHWRLFKELAGTDGCLAELDQEKEGKQSRIVVGVGNEETRLMLERVSERLSVSTININRAHLDVIEDDEGGTVTLLTFLVVGPDGGPIDRASALWKQVRKDLKRVKWIDPPTIQLAYKHSDPTKLNLVRAEILDALCSLAHQVLVKKHPYLDRERILDIAVANDRNLGRSVRIVELFLQRFEPEGPLPDGAFRSHLELLRREIEADADHDTRIVFSQLLHCIDSVLRTNVFLEDRYGIAMRLDPVLLSSAERQHRPFGIFFVHGRGFSGFHVRFRDIARGGVRAVRTHGAEQHARESTRLYDEAFGLASAQQLKNKDIPEGGSKAVLLVAPNESLTRCVKAFADGLLDLITTNSQTRARVVDRFGRDELIYLGPDENITPEHIEWIVERARRRGYPTPTAFMSSKPGAGINHKVYGVTSEGITVFLDVALRHVGIDPKRQPFTVKITGGPDGDVAGNEIKILIREYGSNVRIIGIADGSGCGEDPQGLDHAELLRLVQSSDPIAAFDRGKLGPKGHIVAVEEADGPRLRNTMHNRLASDVFVPGGGRPNTIHFENWQEFLTADGKPSSPVIVEGANLFLTPEARKELWKKGCFIVKDSSANKCGVICSSYEIVACMLLSDKEFLEIKECYVAEVLEKLRDFARREAELLLRVAKNHPELPLTEASTRISQVIISTADAIEAALGEPTKADAALWQRLILDHLPKVLVETAGDRLWQQIPESYLRWLKAKSLAARIVYHEGFESIESVPSEAVASVAFAYLRAEHERNVLAERIEKSNLAERVQIAALLRSGGILASLGKA